MITLRLSTADIARLRFSISPLWECVSLIWSGQAEPPRISATPWLARVVERASRLSLPMLRALVDRGRPYMVDFLAPPPVDAESDFEAELARVRLSPPATVVRELRRAGVGAEAGTVAATLAQVERELRRVWRSALQPDWSRVRAILDGDIIVRGRTLAREGAHVVLDGLHERLSVTTGFTIRIRDRRTASAFGRGRGAVLVPSVFAWPELFVVHSPPWRLTIAYPARGVLAQSHGERSAEDRLERIIGRSRARVIGALRGGATSSELAARLGLTAGAVSQILARLREADVVAASRVGKFVVNDLTPRGAALLRAFDEA